MVKKFAAKDVLFLLLLLFGAFGSELFPLLQKTIANCNTTVLGVTTMSLVYGMYVSREKT